jgi:hypothetical protein
MSGTTSDSTMLENAIGLIRTSLIRQLNKLIGGPLLDNGERLALLDLSSALAALPLIDSRYSFTMDIDFSWDDLNWVGTLNFHKGEFSLHSTMCQLEGLEAEFYAQWQHTAIRLKEQVNNLPLVKHDPAHLWLWIRCFKRFVDNLVMGRASDSLGTMKCRSLETSFVLSAQTINCNDCSE